MALTSYHEAAVFLGDDMRLAMTFFACGLMFVSSTVAAGAAEKVGVIETANRAHLDSADAAIGSDCFPGDRMDTEQHGDLRFRIGLAQVQLGESSAVTLVAMNATTDTLQMEQGGLRFTSPAGEDLEIGTPAGVVRGVRGQYASGAILIVNPHQLVISAMTGNLIVDNDGELHTIAAGKTYRVDVDPDEPPQPPQGNTPNKRRRRKLAFTLITLGAMGFAGFEAWQALTVSPSKP